MLIFGGRCLEIEAAMTAEFLELMHQPSGGAAPLPVGDVHPPRRTHSRSWPPDPLETHHLDG